MRKCARTPFLTAERPRANAMVLYKLQRDVDGNAAAKYDPVCSCWDMSHLYGFRLEAQRFASNCMVAKAPRYLLNSDS